MTLSVSWLKCWLGNKQCWAGIAPCVGYHLGIGLHRTLQGSTFSDTRIDIHSIGLFLLVENLREIFPSLTLMILWVFV